MKSFTKFVGSLPFIGKMSIRTVTYNYYQSMDWDERIRRYFGLMAFMVIFAFAHGVQAKMGIDAYSFSAPILVKYAFGLYALVNIAVTIAQLHIAARATVFLFEKSYPAVDRDPPEWSSNEMFTMLSVTLGGQSAFLALYNAFGN